MIKRHKLYNLVETTIRTHEQQLLDSGRTPDIAIDSEWITDHCLMLLRSPLLRFKSNIWNNPYVGSITHCIRVYYSVVYPYAPV